MVELIVGLAVFSIGGRLYSRYVYRRFVPPLHTLPWLDRGRFVLLCVAVAISVVLAIPVAIATFAYALKATGCPPASIPSTRWICSSSGRLSVLMGVCALGPPVAAIWMRCLLGLLKRGSTP